MKKYSYSGPGIAENDFEASRDTTTALPDLASSAAVAACRLRNLVGMACTRDGLVADLTLQNRDSRSTFKAQVYGIGLEKDLGAAAFDSMIYLFDDVGCTNMAYCLADVRPLSLLCSCRKFDVVIFNRDFQISKLPRMLRYLVDVEESEDKIVDQSHIIHFHSQRARFHGSRPNGAADGAKAETKLRVRVLASHLSGAINERILSS